MRRLMILLMAIGLMALSAPVTGAETTDGQAQIAPDAPTVEIVTAEADTEVTIETGLATDTLASSEAHETGPPELSYIHTEKKDQDQKNAPPRLRR
jgi:hypothetical protein